MPKSSEQIYVPENAKAGTTKVITTFSWTLNIENISKEVKAFAKWFVREMRLNSSYLGDDQENALVMLS